MALDSKPDFDALHAIVAKFERALLVEPLPTREQIDGLWAQMRAELAARSGQMAEDIVEFLDELRPVRH